MCTYFGKSRQAYYKGIQQSVLAAEQQARILELVRQVRRRHARLGGKKLYKLLGDDIHALDQRLGRDKFFALLSKHELLVRRKRKYAVTTQSRHRFRVYVNQLQDKRIESPHQAWVCDITYLRTRKGFVYLFLITDSFSRKIVGWELSESLGLAGALKSLKGAIAQCPCTSGLIHHSDRGFQYCSHAYVDCLQRADITISMAEAGNCYENAMAERMNGILKQEYSLDQCFANLQEARRATREAIQLYNHERPHWSIDLKTPALVHQLSN